MFSALSHEASPEQCLATSTTRSKTEGLKEGSACMSQYVRSKTPQEEFPR